MFEHGPEVPVLCTIGAGVVFMHLIKECPESPRSLWELEAIAAAPTPSQANMQGGKGRGRPISLQQQRNKECAAGGRVCTAARE